MKLLQFLGISKPRAWQELIGVRPHMIDPDNGDAGYGKRKSYKVQGRIAMIDVRGLLINDEDYWDGYGCSTYDRIAEEVRGAADDPAVDGILLRVNSPGGECDNAFETAAEIVAVGKKKPVWSVAETSAYSAGYLLASSASRVYIPPYTGGVGSIGVYSVHMDMSGYLDQIGIKPTFMEAGKGKTEGHPYKPLSAEGRKKMQGEVDRLYTMFVDHVSAQRDIPAGAIRERGAAIMHGSEAISAGLADRLGNTAVALREMREYLDAQAGAITLPGVAATAAQEVTVADETVAPEVAEAFDAAADPTATVVITLPDPLPTASAVLTVAPDPVVAARQDRANADRIKALCAIAGLGADKIQEFVASGKTPEQVESDLLAMRAAEDEKTSIVSQLQPHTAAVAGPANLNESPIVQAAARLAQAGKEK